MIDTKQENLLNMAAIILYFLCQHAIDLPNDLPAFKINSSDILFH